MCQRYTFLFFVLLSCNIAFSQGLNVEYGKNRVQFHSRFDDWSQYESPSFTVYWSGDGRSIGQSAVQMAEYDLAEIQSLLEYRINERIEIIAYNDLTDLKQTNIGKEEAFTSTGGQTKIVGNKVFVHFDGNHQHLRQEIREGIAAIYLNYMFFGANLQEMVQSAVTFDVPRWYEVGLVAYAGEEWNSTIDNQLKFIFLNNKYTDFKEFALHEPRLAGQSFWYYVGQNFGRSNISNLLYLTRINRNIDNGFLYVLGSPYYKVMENWESYFRKRYEAEGKIAQNTNYKKKKIEVKNRRNQPISQVHLSPNGKSLVYVINEIGRFKVYLQDIKTGNRTIIHKGGFRNPFQETDYNYPIVAWKPNSQELSILYEVRDVAKLLTYELATQKKVTELLSPEYQRVFSMDYLDNTRIALSAAINGLTDIFIYHTVGRTSERVTADFYDDLDVRVTKIGKHLGVLFASNRPDSVLTVQKLDTLLPIGNFDIFYYDLDKKGARPLVQVTHTPDISERQPVGIDTTFFGYLTDETGVSNRHVAYLDSVIGGYKQSILFQDGTKWLIPLDSVLTKADSSNVFSSKKMTLYKTVAFPHLANSYPHNIEFHDVSVDKKLALDVLQEDKNKYFFYLDTLHTDIELQSTNTTFRQLQLKQNRKSKGKEITNKKDTNNLLEPVTKTEPEKTTLPKDTVKAATYDYYFQSEFDNAPMPKTTVAKKEEIEETPDKPVVMPRMPLSNKKEEAKALTSIHKFRQSRIIGYQLKFKTDFVTTQMDNSPLFGGLNSYVSSPNKGFSYPPPGILMKANFKDLLEDYAVEAGIRVPTNLNGVEYFALLDDRKHRWDKRYAFYRRMNTYSDEIQAQVAQPRRRATINLGQFELRYPFDIFTSFRLITTLRFDDFTQNATDSVTLKIPRVQQQRLGLRAEYVYDNSYDVSINIKNGTRYKIYGEVMKQIQVQILDNPQANFKKGYMGVVGIDARHYQRILKHSIWASRLAGASAFGTEKILYFLGGVDNWLAPKFSNDISVPNGNYAFQTLAAQMRGFRQNVRNGNSYLLFNTEIRVPVFKYIRPDARSKFIQNFHVVGFFDAGTAWHGRTPFGSDNPLNTITIKEDNNPVTVTVNYFRDPIVAGYGLGVRSTLFGYFLKLDRAWGIETRALQSPMWYLSMGTDF
ncbi:MAG: hypothetical protein RLZZ292_2058 [Bacteroidota bacterium]|jgi:hypothetical protein